MPKHKKNIDYEPKPNLWHYDLLYKFIEGKPLPETWGRHIWQRCENALQLVSFLIAPPDLAFFEPSPRENDAVDYYQSTLGNLFIKAPDYFLALATFIIKEVPAFNQTEKVATLLLDQATQLPRTKDGKLAGDKEIADFFAKQTEHQLKGLNSSVVGKARKYLKRREELRSKKTDLLNDEYETQCEKVHDAYLAMVKTPDFVSWYKNIQKEVTERNKTNPLLLQTAPENSRKDEPYERKEGHTYNGPVNMPPEENEELESTYFFHYMANGTEFRPHERETRQVAEARVSGPSPANSGRN